LFLDDSYQGKCTRPGIGKLVAVGGISIDAQVARELDQAIDAICEDDFGFPPREPFKWSPGRNHWMRDKLVAERREAFFRAVLAKAAEHRGIGHVAICDATKKMATTCAQTHEMDVLVLALERFDLVLQEEKEPGLVIVARPSGGRGDEDTFLSECVEIVATGTDYRKFKRFATNVLTMPYPNSRILQVADLVVSITTAMVAGSPHAVAVFPGVRELLRSTCGRIGGVGVKIHPDFCYANLYHWLLGDETFWRSQSGYPLPMKTMPFAQSEFKY
jgi:hypothetical protein